MKRFFFSVFSFSLSLYLVIVHPIPLWLPACEAGPSGDGNPSTWSPESRLISEDSCAHDGISEICSFLGSLAIRLDIHWTSH